jgi:predicted nucleotidyltransferase
MITMRQIEDVSGRIAAEFEPERILLFGSYAWGAPSPDSDVDLLVILPFEGKTVAKSVEMRLKIKPPFPVDLLVRTPEKIHERLALGDPFIRSILEKGKVLYEANYG